MPSGIELIKVAHELFKKSLFKIAFIGDKSFYWEDYVGGPGVQDTGMVMKLFFEWLKQQENAYQTISDLTYFLQDELRNDRALHIVTSGLVSIQLVREYCIVAFKNNWWPITKEGIVGMLMDCIKSYSNEELVVLNIKRDVEKLVKIFPESHAILDVINGRLNGA